MPDSHRVGGNSLESGNARSVGGKSIRTILRNDLLFLSAVVSGCDFSLYIYLDTYMLFEVYQERGIRI
jgi:hypothetical protein